VLEQLYLSVNPGLEIRILREQPFLDIKMSDVFDGVLELLQCRRFIRRKHSLQYAGQCCVVVRSWNWHPLSPKKHLDTTLVDDVRIHFLAVRTSSFADFAQEPSRPM